jgi:acetyl-CoA carboxylase carboxyl transferase subunit alpha
MGRNSVQVIYGALAAAFAERRLSSAPLAAFLDFEQPIAELEAKIEELRHVTSESEVNLHDEIGRLQAKSRQLTVSIFANLTPWQITQLARHPHRPYTLDYVNAICAEFNELHGDRMYADDGA